MTPPSEQEGVERWTIGVCENCRAICGSSAVVHLVGRTVATERECGRVVQVEVAPVSELQQALSERDQWQAEARRLLERNQVLADRAQHSHSSEQRVKELEAERDEALARNDNLIEARAADQVALDEARARVSELEGALEDARSEAAQLRPLVRIHKGTSERLAVDVERYEEALADIAENYDTTHDGAQMAYDRAQSALSPSLGDE